MTTRQLLVLVGLALVAALGAMTGALGFVLWRNRRKGSQAGRSA